MASAAVFSSIRRRRTPSLEALLAPVEMSEVFLLETLSTMLVELISRFSRSKTPPFQRKNSRNLIRKIEVFAVLLECLMDASSGLSLELSTTSALCFKELYLVLYRSKILLQYCLQSSKLWLLLQNNAISGHFHDLNQEIGTLLDVLPLDDWNLPLDVVEQVELLKVQSKNGRLFIDMKDEMLRLKLYSFLNEFEGGCVPDQVDLYSFFAEGLDVRDVRSFQVEIDFMEEQIVKHDGDIEPTASVLSGFVALTRYCRILLFGFGEDELEMKNHKTQNNGMISRSIADTFITIPKDFCCPISLDLMMDPVIVATGQTYERSSISRWMDDGHCTCPKTGQMLVHTKLVPNRSLRILIMKWCAAHGLPHDSHAYGDSGCNERIVGAAPSKAAIQANRATIGILVGQLANGTHGAKTIAVREIRLLAKNGKENRAYIAECGAIPYLKKMLLCCDDAVAQENSVTAMLNLSIYDKNKCRIMDEEGCLGTIVSILKFGFTIEARENAAATLFSLSAVHDYKKSIAEEDGAVEALAGLLREGTPRGKKDAITALFNLSTHTGICNRMIESGAVSALVWALGCEGVTEEAGGALALIVCQPVGAEAVGKEETAVAALISLMQFGTPKGKENAVAALLELCRNGGAAAAEKVLKAPALTGVLHSLLFMGTKRARRKAVSLVRLFHRFEDGSLHYGGSGGGYPYSYSRMSSTATATATATATGREMSFSGDYAISINISVPVL